MASGRTCVQRLAIGEVIFELRGASLPELDAFATELPAEFTFDVEPSEAHYVIGGPRRFARDGSRISYDGPRGRGTLDLTARVGQLEIVDLQSNPRGLPMLLRFFLGALLPERGGLLLHGAAFVRGGRGYLFVGPSGAGKSTISELAAGSGALVLNDEVVAIRTDPDDPSRARVYGTPLGSARQPVGGAGDAPLTLIGGLRQTAAPVFTHLPRSAAVELLLAHTVGAPETLDASRLLDTALELSALAPAGVLGFRKAPDFWDVLPS